MIDSLSCIYSRIYKGISLIPTLPSRLPKMEFGSWVSLKSLQSWIWKDLSSDKPGVRHRKLREITVRLQKRTMCDRLLTLDENLYVMGLIKTFYEGKQTLTRQENEFLKYLQVNNFVKRDLFSLENAQSETLSTAFDCYLDYIKRLKNQNRFYRSQPITHLNLPYALDCLVPLKSFISAAILFPKLQDKKDMVSLPNRYFDLFEFFDEFKVDDTPKQACQFFNDFAKIFFDPVQTKNFKNLASFHPFVPFIIGGIVTGWGELGSIIREDNKEEDNKEYVTSHQLYWSLQVFKAGGNNFTPAAIRSFHQRLLSNQVSFCELLEWKCFIHSIELPLKYIFDKIKEEDLQDETVRDLFRLLKTVSSLVSSEGRPKNSSIAFIPKVFNSKITFFSELEKIVKIREKLEKKESLASKEELSLLLNMLCFVAITDKEKMPHWANLNESLKEELDQWHTLFVRKNMSWESLDKLRRSLELMMDEEIKQAISKLHIISETSNEDLKLEDRLTRKECDFLSIVMKCLKPASKKFKFFERLWVSLNHPVETMYRVCILNHSKYVEKLRLLEEVSSVLSSLISRIKVLFARVLTFFLPYGYVDIISYNMKDKKFLINGLNSLHDEDFQVLKYNPCMEEFNIKPKSLMTTREQTREEREKFKGVFFHHLMNIMNGEKPKYGTLKTFIPRFLKAKFFPRKVTPLQLDETPSKQAFCSQYICESIIRATVRTYNEYGYEIPNSLPFFGFKEKEDLNGLTSKRLRDVFLNRGILKPAATPYR